MKKFILLSLFVAGLCVAPVFAFADTATDQLIAKLQAQIAELQAQIAALQKGSEFHDGDRVQVDVNFLNIRSNAGIHAPIIGKAPRGARGVLKCKSVPHDQCPVTINDYTWWYIVWDDTSLPSGWSAEASTEAQFLIKEPTPSPTSSSSIQVLSPNGGEMWQKGTTQIIQWLASSSIPSVSISLDSWYACLYTSPACKIAQRHSTLSDSATNNPKGAFLWTVGKDASNNDIPEGQYTITVSGGNFSDASNAPFSIVPNTASTTVPADKNTSSASTTVSAPTTPVAPTTTSNQNQKTTTTATTTTTTVTPSPSSGIPSNEIKSVSVSGNPLSMFLIGGATGAAGYATGLVALLYNNDPAPIKHHYSWSITGGALPPGLSLLADMGTGTGFVEILDICLNPGDAPYVTTHYCVATPETRITGTPTQSGTYTFTVSASRDGVVVASRPFTILIVDPTTTVTS